MFRPSAAPFVGVLAGGAVAILLSGCIGGTADSDVEVRTPTPAASDADAAPAPSGGPPPALGPGVGPGPGGLQPQRPPVVGEVIDSATAIEVRRSPGGTLWTYAMVDGAEVLVDRSGPVPEVVVADARERIRLAQDSDDPYWRIGEQIRSITAQTGKRTVVVVQIPGYGEDDVVVQRGWAVWDNFTSYELYPSKDAAVETAESDLATQPNPEDWLLLIP